MHAEEVDPKMPPKPQNSGPPPAGAKTVRPTKDTPAGANPAQTRVLTQQKTPSPNAAAQSRRSPQSAPKTAQGSGAKSGQAPPTAVQQPGAKRPAVGDQPKSILKSGPPQAAQKQSSPAVSGPAGRPQASPQAGQRIRKPAETGLRPGQRVQKPAETGPQPAQRINQKTAQPGPQPGQRVQKPAQAGPQPGQRVQKPAATGLQPGQRVQKPAETGPQPGQRVQKPAETARTGAKPAETVPRPRAERRLSFSSPLDKATNRLWDDDGDDETVREADRVVMKRFEEYKAQASAHDDELSGESDEDEDDESHEVDQDHSVTGVFN